MKVLWMCNIVLPQIAKSISKPVPVGGGWLVGTLNDFMDHKDYEISVCFPLMNEEKLLRGTVQGISYYGFPMKRKDIYQYPEKIEQYAKEILKEVQPDVIHIFGTEFPHTLAMINACKDTNQLSRVVVSIQGLTYIYAKHYFADLPGYVRHMYSIRDLLRFENLSSQRNKFIKRGEFEKQSILNVEHIIGRTDWDQACVEQMNPEVSYHFCNETLRPAFYEHHWSYDQCEPYSIFVSQSSYPIKGFHYMLEALAIVLQSYPEAKLYTTGRDIIHQQNFKSKLRNSYYTLYLRHLIRKYHLENQVFFLGDLNEENMCARYLKSNVFVSPSSIENSSNSIGEAMLLGVPTISSDVGGIKDLLLHNEEGYIYQHDAPYMLAYYICKIFKDRKQAEKLSNAAKSHAMITHSHNRNLAALKAIYNDICNK